MKKSVPKDGLKRHDLKNAVLLLKQLAELLEGGFSPSEEERKDIVKQLKKSYEILKEEVL